MPDQHESQGFSASPQQRRLAALVEGGKAGAYRGLGEIAVEGPVTPMALTAALDRVVARHEILRTCFAAGPGVLVQRIVPPAPLAWRRCDLSAVPGPDQEIALAALRREAAAVELDLSAGPILQAWLATLAADRHLLFLALPALCADAVSFDLLAAELGRSWAGEEGNEGEILQYADAAEWLNHLLQAEDRAEARAAWAVGDLPAQAAAPAPWEIGGGMDLCLSASPSRCPGAWASGLPPPPATWPSPRRRSCWGPGWCRSAA